MDILKGKHKRISLKKVNGLNSDLDKEITESHCIPPSPIKRAVSVGPLNSANSASDFEDIKLKVDYPCNPLLDRMIQFCNYYKLKYHGNV